MTKRKQIKELIEKLKIANQNIIIQKRTINDLKLENAKIINKCNEKLHKIQSFEAPVQFVQYPERKTSYLIFADGHFARVKLSKGDKNNAEVALMYLLVKNLYDMKKLKELTKNKKLLKKGEKLPIVINTKK